MAWSVPSEMIMLAATNAVGRSGRSRSGRTAAAVSSTADVPSTTDRLVQREAMLGERVDVAALAFVEDRHAHVTGDVADRARGHER